MPLMRPLPPKQQQNITIDQRPQVEQNLSLELHISRQLELLTGQMLNLHTKLFGDTAMENVQGRLPRLEATADEHEVRLEKLERAQIKYAAWGSAAGFALSGLGWYIVHIVLHLG